MSDSLTSLISSEQPEQFAQNRSFPLSDLSYSLTVAHLSWAIWANEWMSDEQMSEFPALYSTSELFSTVCNFQIGKSGAQFMFGKVF